MFIRNAIDTDIQSIYEIAQLIVIEVNNEVIGYTRFLTDETVTLYITELVVTKSHRKKGYAKALIDYLLAQYPSVRIELLSENNSFYEKLHFRNIGTGYRLP
ncbi:GNAT family N-acetyltransferase [Mammaliicoccus sciuri]|uniref:GNAT family N-acetyltransferase n=1 Tax=Mammaliicoccus sciuri TaxID=1296 RepID=UPI000D1E4CBC|nr:GNAT family N-acetyltransferase [Mammaliicoccus sciuri]PTJ50491.1 hypothetical protein BU012_08675 [Mammaliicoccus sciuri]